MDKVTIEQVLATGGWFWFKGTVFLPVYLEKNHVYYKGTIFVALPQNQTSVPNICFDDEWLNPGRFDGEWWGPVTPPWSE